MSSRFLIPIGAFVLWCYVCQQWYVCHIKQVCEEPAVMVADPEVDAPDVRPLVFDWAKSDAITRPVFAAFRDSILRTIPEGGTLEIMGLYAEGEAAPEGFANMGMARADYIKTLFADFLSEDRISTSSRLMAKPPDAETSAFEAINFAVFDPEAEEKAEIVEVQDRVIIQFPYSSAEKEPDPAVDEYIAKLAERLKTTEETVSIIGHTDNTGSDETNNSLGLARARHVQDILISKGIKKARITIGSKGESEPVADNDTEAGRRRNRRAELSLNKAN
ncbi:MAG: OmpA family protein [Bacteroidetes bacterium]|jgi:outer membrane protein OmpA-like peptidoglycan-associated protein|nr:OmpA family protein [Bacteroidota bacterium]